MPKDAWHPAFGNVVRSVTGQLQHPVIAAVGDVERAVLVNANAVRLVQFEFERRAAESFVSLLTGAREANDLSVPWSILTDDVVLRIRDEDIAIKVEAEMFRTVHRGEARVAAVAGAALLTRADQGADRSVRIDEPQRIAAPFQDVNLTERISDDGARIVERRLGGFGTFWRDALATIAGDGVNEAGLPIDGADAVVVEVGEIQLLVQAQRHAVNAAECRVNGRPAVACESLLTSADDSADRS